MKKIRISLSLLVIGLFFAFNACTSECIVHCTCSSTTVDNGPGSVTTTQTTSYTTETYADQTKSECQDLSEEDGCTCSYEWGN